MSAKKKRPKKPEGQAPKATEAPFFRPFSGLPSQALPKPAEGAPKAPPKPVRKVRGAPAAPSEAEDATTFERFMAGVEPLDSSKARRVSKTQAEVDSSFAKRAQSFARERELADQEALHKLHALVQDGSRFEIVDDGRRIEGRRRGADGGVIRRMRDGDVSVDATLDLLSMRGDEARQAVDAFVRDRRARGDRVVVLVYGRRPGSSGGQPFLRGEVAAWLSEGAASKHVSAFLSAPPELGGEGAMCVLLAQVSENHRGMR
jgi:DNA-nicking Smr family endonuclease